MAWINIDDVRFRNPLPKAGKMRISRVQRKCTNIQEGEEEDERISSSSKKSDFNHLLIEENIPSEFQWTSKKREGLETDQKQNRKNESFCNNFWTRKETSCDIELDTIGTTIANITTNIETNMSFMYIILIV